MWNINSNSIQQAKQELELRRSEIETRYAEELQALNAEFEAIETLERAASEFILRRSRRDGAGAADPPLSADPEGGSDGDAGDEQAALRAVDDEVAAAAPLSAVDSGSAETHDLSGGLDILKPGSRWRLYRSGGRSPDPEGAADSFSAR